MSLSEPKITLSCDGKGCTQQEEISLTTTARGYDERGVKSQVEALGWEWADENTHYCVDCFEEMLEG